MIRLKFSTKMQKTYPHYFIIKLYFKLNFLLYKRDLKICFNNTIFVQTWYDVQVMPSADIGDKNRNSLFSTVAIQHVWITAAQSIKIEKIEVLIRGKKS